MRPWLLCLFFVWGPTATRAETGSLETLSELLAQQKKLEPGGPTWALQRLNEKIALLSRDILVSQGYKVGEVKPNPATTVNFIIPLLEGPQSSDIHKVIQKAGDRLQIHYVIQVGGIHFGLYDDSQKQVRLSPRFLLTANPASKKGIFGTILHETRHAFISAKASPLNVDVISRGTQQVTPVELYGNYFHFQEMSTHFRDFHHTMSGVPTLYTLDGLSLPEIAAMKGEKTIQFAEAIQKHSAAAIASLEQGAASTGKLVRDTSVSHLGPAVVVPLTDPGAGAPYADLRVVLPGLGPETPDEEARKIAITSLKRSIGEAQRTGDIARKQLTAFQASPVVKVPCGTAFSRLGGY